MKNGNFFDVRILIGAAGHGYGSNHCSCKQCQKNNGIGGKYAVEILHYDGTFSHGIYNHDGNDNRIEMSDTKLRVQNGPWAEKIFIKGYRSKLYSYPITIDEACYEIKRWKKIRKQNKYNSSDNLLELDRILKATESPDYKTLDEKWKFGCRVKPILEIEF